MFGLKGRGRIDVFGWTLFFAALLLCLALADFSQAKSRANPSACRDFVGTYLIAVFDGPETRIISARSLVSLFADGNFRFIDSNQAGVCGVFNRFTDAAGDWACVPGPGPEQTITAVALDFTLPGTLGPTQQIARLDFLDVTVDSTSGHIAGRLTLRFFAFGGDPLDPGPHTEAPLPFDGQRVKAGH